MFTATDATGTTALNDLTIKLGETNVTALSANNKPKAGDMLVVSHTLSEGKVEKSAYVYGKTGWEACDGNVDASKVILTQNITMAGNYTSIGNFSKTNTAGKNSTFMDGNKGTAGVSVYELIKQMLSKTVEPTWQRNPPTATLEVTNPSECEIGTTVSAKFSATFNDAYAKYTGGSDQKAGCTASGYKFDGATTSQTGNSVTKSWVAGDTAPSATVAIDYSASTNTIKNNLGDAATITPSSIAAGTTATTSSVTASVSCYRKVFYKALPLENKLSEEEIIALVSSDIRGYTGQKARPTSWAYTNSAQFLIFVPADQKALKEAKIGVLPITFTKLKYGANDYKVKVEGYNGYTSVDYVVWVATQGSDSSDTITLTWN